MPLQKSNYCTICEKKGFPNYSAEISLPEHGYNLCKKHYREWFLRRLNWTISRFKRFSKGEKILVGISGGLDSAVLAHALGEAGFSVEGIHIVLGKSEYQKKSLEFARKAARSAGIALREEVSKGEIVGEGKKNPCAACSEARNFFLNKISRDENKTFATGHHLDDEVSAILEGTIDWNPDVLGRRAPLVFGIEGFGKKAKPLCLFSKRELAIWAKIFKLPYIREKCPYSKEPRTARWKEAISCLKKNSQVSN